MTTNWWQAWEKKLRLDWVSFRSRWNLKFSLECHSKNGWSGNIVRMYPSPSITDSCWLWLVFSCTIPFGTRECLWRKRKQPHDGYDYPSKTIPKFNIYDVGKKKKNVNQRETRKRSSSFQSFHLDGSSTRHECLLNAKVSPSQRGWPPSLNSRIWKKKPNGSWSSLEKLKQEETSFFFIFLRLILLELLSFFQSVDDENQRVFSCRDRWRTIRTEQPTPVGRVVRGDGCGPNCGGTFGSYCYFLLCCYFYFFTSRRIIFMCIFFLLLHVVELVERFDRANWTFSKRERREKEKQILWIIACSVNLIEVNRNA